MMSVRLHNTKIHLSFRDGLTAKDTRKLKRLFKILSGLPGPHPISTIQTVAGLKATERRELCLNSERHKPMDTFALLSNKSGSHQYTSIMFCADSIEDSGRHVGAGQRQIRHPESLQACAAGHSGLIGAKEMPCT